MACTCSPVSLFRNFVAVSPAFEKALSDGAKEAGAKVRLPIRGNAISICGEYRGTFLTPVPSVLW